MAVVRGCQHFIFSCVVLMEGEEKQEYAHQRHGMKARSAPGPNDFNITFFKKLWHLIKGEIWCMVEDFNKNSLDLRRLNYRIITLVQGSQHN
jgi:hypothetical protein